MIAWIVLPTLLIYVILLGCMMAYLQIRSRQEVELDMTRRAATYAARFDACLREVAAVAETTARSLSIMPSLSEDQLFDQLTANTEPTPFIYGACIAFEPGTYPNATRLYAPYVHRTQSGLDRMIIDENVYDWYGDPRWTWYREPKALGRGVWSAPYFDEGAGNALMTTYSAPFFRKGAFAGVATVDIDLPKLQENIGRDIVRDLDFVILTSSGQFVYSRDADRIMRKSIYDVATETNRPDIAALAPRILGGSPGISTVKGWETPDRQWLFYAPISTAGWTFVASVSERVALADVRSRLAVVAGGLGVTMLLIIGAIVIVSDRITRPIRRLAEKVLEIGNGDLNVRIDGVPPGDEIGQLADNFNLMTQKLRVHVQELAEAHAARKRVEHDMAIARDIQRGLLPERLPKLPGFELAGWSLPADDTGGDYYDWQELPNGNTAITLADATGHGIGPALVTAVCRAYARASFPSIAGLGVALDRINGLLVEDLKEGRFVTFVVAVVDVQGGKVDLLSAGQGPILLYRASDQQVHQFNPHHIPFGIFAEVGYGPPSSLVLADGDMLVLVTDGFFEWANSAGELFGADRLAQVIMDAAKTSPAQVIESMYQSVTSFASGTPQLDDLTAVVLKRTA